MVRFPLKNYNPPPLPGRRKRLQHFWWRFLILDWHNGFRGRDLWLWGCFHFENRRDLHAFSGGICCWSIYSSKLGFPKFRVQGFGFETGDRTESSVNISKLGGSTAKFLAEISCVKFAQRNSSFLGFASNLQIVLNSLMISRRGSSNPYRKRWETTVEILTKSWVAGLDGQG